MSWLPSLYKDDRERETRPLLSQQHQSQDVESSQDHRQQGVSQDAQEIGPPPHWTLPYIMKAAGIAVVATSLVSFAAFSLAAPTTSPTATQQSVFTAPSAFPTSDFSSYYQAPDGYSSEPRPVIHNPIYNFDYPETLDDPLHLPTANPTSEAVYPEASSSAKPSASLYNDTISQIESIINSTDASQSNCTKCQNALELAQKLVRAEPKSGPKAMIELCQLYKYGSSKTGLTVDEDCARTYAGATYGSAYTQILSYINLTQGSQDGIATCAYILDGYCDVPGPIELTKSFLNNWFNGDLLGPSSVKRKTGQPLTGNRAGENLKALHMSDIHVDPRYLVGSEAACTNGQCCRQDSFNSTKTHASAESGTILNSSLIVEPAAYWGSYECDSPWPLVATAFEAVTKLNGGEEVDWTMYTGDLTTHDAAWHISHDLVTQAETALFTLMKKHFGSGSVYPALGNHDTAPADLNSPNDLPAGHETYSWNYDFVSALWKSEGWLKSDVEAAEVRHHYGGYSVSPRAGLRLISLNGDMWYPSNPFIVINYTNPDNSGMLRFLTDELDKAEKNEEAVFIITHVIWGWSGSNSLPNPTNLVQTIMQRYHRTIRAVFQGHTHETLNTVFFNNNATSTNVSQAIAATYIGGSVTPGTNVNPSFSLVTIDPETYDIMDLNEYATDAATFPTLPSTNHGPVWKHLYSARSAYSNFSAVAAAGTNDGPVTLDSQGFYPSSAPLNATFYALLAEEMTLRPSVAQLFTINQGRNSSLSPNCTSTVCADAKACYLRSGTQVLGSQCVQGYDSVQ